MKFKWLYALSLGIICSLVIVKSVASSDRTTVVVFESDSAAREQASSFKTDSISISASRSKEVSLSTNTRSQENNHVLQTPFSGDVQPADASRNIQKGKVGKNRRRGSYWTRAWAELCRQAQFSATVKEIGIAELGKVVEGEEEGSSSHELKRCLSLAHSEELSDESAESEGRSTVKLPPMAVTREVTYRKNAQKTLETLTEILAAQNRELAHELKHMADLKEQEMQTAAENRVEDQAQQVCDHWWTRGLAIFSVLSGAGNVVLGAMLTG